MSQNLKPSSQVTKKVTDSALPSGSPVEHHIAIDSTGQHTDDKVLVINNVGFSD